MHTYDIHHTAAGIHRIRTMALGCGWCSLNSFTSRSSEFSSTSDTAGAGGATRAVTLAGPPTPPPPSAAAAQRTAGKPPASAGDARPTPPPARARPATQSASIYVRTAPARSRLARVCRVSAARGATSTTGRGLCLGVGLPGGQQHSLYR